MALSTVAAGTRIISEGEKSASMFILVQGAVEVMRATPTGAPRTVARMTEGAFFGEMGLLSDAPRLASVVAGQECVLLEVTREMIQKLTARFPALEQVVSQFYRERLLANLLRQGPLFHPFSPAQKQAIVKRFRSRTVEAGAVLVRQGQPGEGLHLLLRGRCQVVHQEADGRQTNHPDMREGAVFGEISLLLDSGASVTVRAATPCVVLTLDKDAFTELILSHPEVRRMVTRLSVDRLQRTEELLAREEEPKVGDAHLV